MTNSRASDTNNNNNSSGGSGSGSASESGSSRSSSGVRRLNNGTPTPSATPTLTLLKLPPAPSTSSTPAVVRAVTPLAVNSSTAGVPGTPKRGTSDRSDAEAVDGIMNTLELTPSKRRLVEDIHQMPDTSKATGLLVLGILANRARSQREFEDSWTKSNAVLVPVFFYHQLGAASFTSLDCPAKVFTDLNLPVRPVQDMVKECMDWTEKQQRNYTIATPDAPSETKFAREKTSKLLSAIKTQFKKKLQKWDTRVFNVDQAIQDLYGDDPRHKDKTLDADFPDDALDRKTVVYLLVYCSRLQAAFNLKENYWAYCSALFANFLNPNTNREAVLVNVRFQLMGEEVEQVVCQPSPAVPESSLRGPESSQSPTVLPNSPEAIQEQDNE